MDEQTESGAPAVEGQPAEADAPKTEQATSPSQTEQTSTATDLTTDTDLTNIDTEQFNPDTEQQSNNTEQPKADTEEPNTDTDQPKTDTEQPNTDTEQPNTDIEQPNTDTDQPKTDTEQPSPDTEQPNTDTEQPSADTEQPSADTEQPNTDTDQDQPVENRGEDKRRRSVYGNHHLESYTWEPEPENVKGLVCLCHGIFEHMGRYEKLVENLKSEGLLVFGIDLVGHGKSEGPRGIINELQSYANDVISFAEEMKEKYSELPMFLMGHSMGGLIATMIAIQRQNYFKGLLLSSPCLMVDPNTAGPIKKLFIKIIGSIYPQWRAQSIDVSMISSLPEEVDEYRNDPLIILEPVTAGVGVALMKAMDDVQGKLRDLTLPLFIMHGSDDHLVPMAASELAYNNVSSADKILEVFIDCRHEILHDKEQERAKELISSWILSRIAD